MKLTTQEILAKLNIIIEHLRDFQKENLFGMTAEEWDKTIGSVQEKREEFIKKEVV